MCLSSVQSAANEILVPLQSSLPLWLRMELVRMMATALACVHAEAAVAPRVVRACARRGECCNAGGCGQGAPASSWRFWRARAGVTWMADLSRQHPAGAGEVTSECAARWRVRAVLLLLASTSRTGELFGVVCFCPAAHSRHIVTTTSCPAVPAAYPRAPNRFQRPQGLNSPSPSATRRSIANELPRTWRRYGALRALHGHGGARDDSRCV